MQPPRFGEETRRQVEDGLEFMTGAYLVGLASWFVLQQLIGDATWWLFLINAFAVYLFAPLPLALVVSVWRRSLALIGGSLAGAALFALLWGVLFWPHERPNAEGPVLTVMTYNLLAPNPDIAGVVEALTAADADVITLQELSPRMAAAIESDLLDVYPYQALSPRRDTGGLGILSRLPLEMRNIELSDYRWIGVPMIAEIDFGGTPFVLVNAHSSSGVTLVADRERQARLLADYLSRETLPVILMGDFNALDTNESYEIVSANMMDAWREIGRGLGNTFPGASQDVTPGSKRPRILGIDVPKWLLRIDYVFHSDDWQAVDARIGPWDGYSDHRPVIAELALKTGP